LHFQLILDLEYQLRLKSQWIYYQLVQLITIVIRLGLTTVKFIGLTTVNSIALIAEAKVN